jgi:excisionase family DNA binding protein
VSGAPVDLEGSSFATRAELGAWLVFCDWLNDHDADPEAYLWLGSGTGWVPAVQVELRSRAPSVLPKAGASAAPTFLTLQEASALVRVPAETIRYWIWQGRLVAFKPGRAVLVREAELLALVEIRETRKIRAARGAPKRVVVAG